MDLEAENQKLAAVATELTADADRPAELEGQPGRFRMATKVWFVLTLLSIGAIVVGSEGILVLGVIMVIVGSICLLTFGINDLLVPLSRDRSTSDKAIRAYFRGMQRGRWDTTFATLAPVAREHTVMVPEIRELKTVRKARTRSTKKDLKAYWRSFIHPHGGLNRRLEKVRITPIDTEGLMHRHRIEMRVTYYPSWVVIGILAGLLPMLIIILIVRKTHTATFDVSTFKHKSQWWVLDGELKAPLQGAPYGAGQLPRARVV
jgi:hypothetical protein